MEKYKNINYISLISMAMVFTIHYWNSFYDYVDWQIATILMLFFRAIALPAVVLYLITTAYFYFYEQKSINFRNLLLYIIIPTLIVEQLLHYSFGFDAAEFNLHDGFIGTWFADMYIGALLLIPSFKKLDAKGGLIANCLLAFCICLVLIGYGLTIYYADATLASIGLLMAIPYVALIYLLFKLLTLAIKHLPLSQSKLLLLALLMIIAQMLAYADFFPIREIVISYFSPFTIALALALWLYIYQLDMSKLSVIRPVSKTSYFFYISHYFALTLLENKFITFATLNTWQGLIIGILISYLVSIFLFYIYDFIINSVLAL